MEAQELFKLGKEKLKKRELDAALDAFNKALELDHENPFYLCERAVVYHHKKDNQRALKDMDLAVKVQPDYPYRYSSRAYIRASMGDVRGGIEDYKKAIQLDPNDAVAHNNLGLLQEQLGYMKSSKESYGKADKLSDKMSFVPQNSAQDFSKEDSNKLPKAGETLNVHEKVQEKSSWKVMLSIFKSKKTFGEFIQFIKSGFKIEK